jgi:hypothetical protein
MGVYGSLAGRVRCKVVGPVRAGDLLRTSSRSGDDIRTDEPEVGAIVGKALQDMPDESGVIDVWVGGF